jgi:hypothetical protein
MEAGEVLAKPGTRRKVALAAALVWGSVGLWTLPAAAAVPHVGIPTSCPAVSVVRKMLNVKVNTVSSNVSVPQFPGNTHPQPTLLETCVYSFSGLFTKVSNIVPVTVSFQSDVTMSEFNVARRNAGLSSAFQGATHTLTGVGNSAWLMNPPHQDPRAGRSLFILSGTTDIVISAPPSVSVAGLRALAVWLVKLPRQIK